MNMIINTMMSQNLLLILLCLCFVASLTHASDDHQRKTYIVYMGELSKSKPSSSFLDDHHNLLLSAIGDERVARESKIHSYGKSFNGFAARLLPHEATTLMDKENVVSVFESTTRELHTTRSWSFLGMPNLHHHHHHHLHTPKTNESDLIIGMLDTGIYIDAASFNDKGFGSPPSKWKGGSCGKALNFSGCNNKVIGAKSFRLDQKDPENIEKSPVDMDGHGTHTASTAAGVAVKGASLYGIARGTARGGVPGARLAAYKVCWGIGCSDADLLAGFDEAIADGVDVISVSVGGPSRHFFVDVISIGSFHAMKNGILTVCSAGNSGPDNYSVENVWPWILTVGASSIDRKFVTQVRFGNGNKIYGMSINTFSARKKSYSLISGAQASKSGSSGNASACEYGTIGHKVKGKIVYCLGSSYQDGTINLLGGEGTIMSTPQQSDIATTTLIPGTIVTLQDGNSIAKYINSTKNPTAVIHRTTSVKMTAPFIASFSSRGPQIITPNILKPDIAAPGLNILAAYSKLNSITGSSRDKRFTTYNIMSGTSMACPHATAAAVYVKSFHPDWSPSAIKSALMTTATPMKVQEMGAELGSGSGQINPTAAVDPGLVYDLRMSYYLRFLCTQGYNSTTIGLLLGGKKKYHCSGFKPAALGLDGLNYPSMHINIGRSNSAVSAVFYRTVTNVGDRKSVYKAKVKSPKGLSIEIIPRTLEFDRPGQRQSFKVKVKVKGRANRNRSQVVTAMLEWTDSKHTVRSPIVAYREASY